MPATETATKPRETAPTEADAPARVRLRADIVALTLRRNRQLMAAWLIAAGQWGLALAALMMLPYRLVLVDGPWWAPVLVVVAALCLGYYLGRLRKLDDFAVARQADDVLQWRELLSSGLAFASAKELTVTLRQPERQGLLPIWLWLQLKAGPSQKYALKAAPVTELVPALVARAAQGGGQLKPSLVFPWKLQRPLAGLCALFCLCLVLAVMPDLPLFRSAQDKKSAAIITQQGEKLVEIAKQVEHKPGPTPQEMKRLTARLHRLGLQMMRGRMTKRAALTDLGELRQKLEQANQKSTQPSSDSAQIAQALRDAPVQSKTGLEVQKDLEKDDAEAAAKKLDDLADRLDKKQLSAPEKEKSAADLQQTAQQLRQRGGEANQRMAQKLEDAAKELRQMPDSPQSAKNSGPPRQNSQNGQAQKSSPSQSGQNQKSQGQSKSASQSGSSNQNQGGQQGQGKGASSSLREMANALRQGSQGSSSSENLRQMLDRIREAESQTGTNDSSASGLGNAAKEGAAQSGDMQQVTPGKDLIPTDPHGMVPGGAGLGPRDHTAGTSGGAVSKLKSRRTGDTRRYADIWSDRLPKPHAQIDRIKGKWGQGGEVEELPTRGEGKGGSVKTPYYKVYESYKQDAEEAVGKDKVPPAYREPVKRYFDSLKP